MVTKLLPADLALEIQQKFDSPNGRGVIRLVEILREALNDPQVCQSRPAIAITELVLLLVEDGLSASSGEDILKPMFKAAESLEQSARARRPRNTANRPHGGKAFVSAIKEGSGRRMSHTAWGWIEDQVDQKIGDFEVVQADGVEARFIHTETGRKGKISRTTFDRYWTQIFRK